jgi:type II secretory pathway pseudopilin PulG
MRTFFATLRSDQRPHLRCPHFISARGLRALVRGRWLSERLQPGGQEGFLLVEVIVSALLVGLIVVATFNGFDVVNRAQADNRAHDQAVILAAQSQEQMRTDPITTLQELENSPHAYTQTINGTTYEIKQEAAPSNGSANTTGCSAIETTRQNGANVLISSSVTWPRLGVLKRPEVKLSSIITPPTGSGLEIDVGNAPAPTAGVGGVTASVTFTPVNSTTPQTLEGTTSSAGCVVFGDIEATAATVEIHEKSGFVTPTGALKVQPKEVKLAPNITVHDPVVYNQGGAIKANFRWKGESVTGDTFVTFNTSLTASPHFEVGSTNFTYEGSGEEQYQAETGKYASSAITAKGTRYSTGDLFPFLAPNLWIVYAGDCLENNPHEINAAIVDGEVLVTAGGTTEVNVPISKTSLLAREGTQKSPSSPVSGLEVKLTNTACAASAVPNNASKLNYWRFQKTIEGTLQFPYQPFGAYELCVATGAPKKKRYKYSASNTTEAGTAPVIYLGAKSPTEKSELKTSKETEEKTTKTNRETEEKTTKTNREAGEKATEKARITEEKPTKEAWEKEVTKNAETKTKEEAKKAERLANEAKEIELWKWQEECKSKKVKATCEKAGKVEITNAERKTKEKTQETNRNTKIGEEETANKNREKAEETAKTNRTNQENTQKAKEKTESETKAANETAENTLKTKRLGEEATTKTNREKAETEETEEATSTKVTVESGVTTC